MRCSHGYTVHRMLFPMRCNIVIEVNDAVIACIFIATDPQHFALNYIMLRICGVLLIACNLFMLPDDYEFFSLPVASV